MPFEIRDEGQFLFARLFGVLSRADLVAEVGFQSILELADTRTRRPLATPVKSALIALRPVHFGFARMFQTLNTNPQIEVRIFATIEEALQWFAKG
ncbi:MAG: hypothetical protein ACREUC_13145 [Steroidobacteraceae bacterium]